MSVTQCYRDFRSIDRGHRHSYSSAMAESEKQSPLESEMERLSGRIETMLQLCEQLHAENQSLRSQRDQLTAERARLVEHMDVARNRVEAMVSRLKALEQGT